MKLESQGLYNGIDYTQDVRNSEIIPPPRSNYEQRKLTSTINEMLRVTYFLTAFFLYTSNFNFFIFSYKQIDMYYPLIIGITITHPVISSHALKRN